MVRFLSDKEIKKIHENTITALEDIGVYVMHEDGLSMLADAGADVSMKTQLAKIPSEVVESCLETAAKEFIMAGRDPENDLSISGSGKIYARNGGGPGHVVDIDTGKVNEATMDDVKNYAKLVDALEYIDIVAPIYAQDTNTETRDIETLAALFASSSKHINMRLLNRKSLPYVIRMAEIVAGSKEALREKPLITMLESPIAPLKLPDVLVDTLITCAKSFIPVEICSMPITGATGPITLSGSLLMSNIEMVASIVVSQLVQPGAPLIFTPRIMVMDMASAYAMTGSIENALLAAAGVQLAKEAYQLPVNMHGPYTDAMTSDIQAGMENTYFTFLPALAGANILTGAGHLNGGLVVSFSQLLLDNELMGIVQRALKGFSVDDDWLGLDAIARSINEDNLLTDDHTMKYLRDVTRYKPGLQVREQRAEWIRGGSRGMKERADELAKELIEEHEQIPLDPAVSKALSEVVREAETTLVSE
ncbi:MAG: trimethylamine methyltransferase family protein [Bacteroidota bacterium]